MLSRITNLILPHGAQYVHGSMPHKIGLNVAGSVHADMGIQSAPLSIHLSLFGRYLQVILSIRSPSMKSTVIVNLIFIANASFFKTGRTSPASPTWPFKNGFCLRFTHSSAHGVRMSSIRQRIKLYPVFGTTLTAGRISLLTIRPLPHLGHRRGSMPVNSRSHSSQLNAGVDGAC
ncbi:MAG: hypothetical protein DKINENOH_04801 [bacterium]|nr:hypothetical protein [bacterium]